MDPNTFITTPEPQEPVVSVSPEKSHFEQWKVWYCAGFVLFTLFVLGYRFLASPPQAFPVDTVIVVKKGETLSGSALSLKETNIIRSPFAFKSLMVLFGGTKGLMAGEYYLEKPQSSLKMAWRLSHGDYELKNVRITIPEGLNSKEIAELFVKEPKFKYFSKNQFIKIATPYEGYLFPETYLFLPNVTAEDVLAVMLDTYKKKIATISEEIVAFKRPIEEIISMASILEEEGRVFETRQVIADILWKRLDEKMPLQVDASVVYLTGKADGNKLTSDDFKLKSPYNTYLNLGFPPTPISNPGLDAIKAAISPTKTKYYFYLTDPEGGFHPATTYDNHLINKAKYLD